MRTVDRQLPVRTPLWMLMAAVGCVCLLPLAAASGSGYNLSYSQAGNGVYPDAWLTSISSTYNGSGAADIYVTFTVQGQVVLWSGSDAYEYWIWFGGSSNDNATAWVWIFDNNTTAYWYTSSGSGGASGFLWFNVLSSSEIGFYISTAIVGPVASYSLNGEAWYDGSGGYEFSWLGTNYQGSNGGGSCSTNCGGGGGTGGSTSSSSSSSSSTGLFIGLAVAAVIAVVVIVVVVKVVLPKRRMPPTAPAPGSTPPPGYAPAAAPPPPGYAPPPAYAPPAPQGYPQAPPPPPPP